MKKVLIVDDEPVIREGLPYIIDWQEYGFEIVGAAQNGKEGIKLINEYQPDLVITDIRMPEMDGLEMIQTAQKRGETFYSIRIFRIYLCSKSHSLRNSIIFVKTNR